MSSSTSRRFTSPTVLFGIVALLAGGCSSPESSNATNTEKSPTITSEVASINDALRSSSTATGSNSARNDSESTMVCDATPIVRSTSTGIKFVRTPDSCFQDVRFSRIDYQPKYVEVEGLRVHYVEAGPANGPVVLMLHGEPTWSYLYRKMIDGFAKQGYHAIAMDFIGMGRSDKPVNMKDYSYIGQTKQLASFIDELRLTDINLVVQDWGANIGLKLVGEQPARFSSVVVANGAMPLFPKGLVPYPPVKNPDELDATLKPYYDGWPDQQIPFRDATGKLLIDLNFQQAFPTWMAYTMKSPEFNPGKMVEANTWFPISVADKAAYNAPFPRREYMALARYWPSMALEVGGVNEKAWAGLQKFDKPFLTLYTPNDVGIMGEAKTYQPYIDKVPGAKGQPHGTVTEASHFLQDDQGYSLAQRIIEFYKTNNNRVATNQPSVSTTTATTKSASEPAPSAEAQKAFTDCLKANGAELPEGFVLPTDGQAPNFPPDTDMAKLSAAFSKCQDKMPR
jgi:haloalkane dehalogenase